MAKSLKKLPSHLQSATLKLVRSSEDPVDVLVTKIHRQLTDVFVVGDEVNFHADNKLAKGEIVSVHQSSKPFQKIDLTEEAAGSPSSDKENSSADSDVYKYNVKVKGKTVSSIPAKVLSRASELPSKGLIKKFVLSHANYSPATATNAAHWDVKEPKNGKKQLTSPLGASKKSKPKTPVQKNTLDSFVKIARVSKSSSSQSPDTDVVVETDTPSKLADKPSSAVATNCKNGQETPKKGTIDAEASPKKSSVNKRKEKSKNVVSKDKKQAATKTVGKVSSNAPPTSSTSSQKSKKVIAKTPTKSSTPVAHQTPTSSRKRSTGTNPLTLESKNKTPVIDITDSGATNLLDKQSMEPEVIDDDISGVPDDESKVAAGCVRVQVTAPPTDSNQKLTHERIGYLVQDEESTASSSTVKRTSVVMKQLTLFDLAKHSGVTGTDTFASMTPPTPKIIRKYRKAVKENNAASQSRLLRHAAVKLTEVQKSRLPPDVRALIEKKQEQMEEREKMKGLTPKERQLFRKQQQEQRNPQASEDLSLAGSADLPEAKVLSLPTEMPDSLIADLLHITQFCVSFKRFLWQPETANYDLLTFDVLARYIVTKDFRALDVMMSLLRTLLNDVTFSEAEELSFPLKTLPLNRGTALGLLYLTFQKTNCKKKRSVEEKEELEKLMAAITSTAYMDLSPTTIVACLKMLCTLLQDTQGVVDYLMSVHTRVANAWKTRNDVMRLQTEFTVKHGLDSSAEGEKKGDNGMSTEQADAAMSSPPQTLSEVLKLRREMAKRSLEERGRKEREQKKQREMEAESALLDKRKRLADSELQDALLARDLSKRVNYWGMDRHYNRYWVFPNQPGLLVERGWASDDYTRPFVDVEAEAEPFVSPESFSYGWLHYDSLEAVDALIKSLNPVGVREGDLHTKLRKDYHIIRESFESSSLKKPENEEVIEQSACESFKETLEDLEDSIRSAALGGVEDYEEWTDSLRKADTVKQLGEHLLRCQAAIYRKRFCGIMAYKTPKPQPKKAPRGVGIDEESDLDAEDRDEVKVGEEEAADVKADGEEAADVKADEEKAADAKTDGVEAAGVKADGEVAAGVKADGEEAAEEVVVRRRAFDWQKKVMHATSFTQLHLMLEILRLSIEWGKSIDKVRCKSCNRKGTEATLLRCDGCDGGYHKSCVGIKNTDAPEDGWYCPNCVLPVQRKKRICYLDEIEESSEEEEEETCTICNKSGQDIALCDTCLAGYHVACHQPPLRSVPRLAWTCHACRFGDKMKQGGADTDNSSQSSKEDGDEHFHKGSKKKYIGKKSKANTRRDSEDESDLERKVLKKSRTNREKTTPRSSKRVTKHKCVDYNESDGESEGSSEEPSQPLHAEGKKKRDSHSKQKAVKQVKDKQKVRSSRKAAAKERDSESEHETDEEVKVKSSSKRHASKSGGEKTTPRPNKRVAASKSVDNREKDSESDGSQQETEEEVKVKPTKRHHKKKGDKGITKVKDKHHSEVGESDVERKRSDREKTTSRSSKRATKHKRVDYNESDGESEGSSEEPSQPLHAEGKKKRDSHSKQKTVKQVKDKQTVRSSRRAAAKERDSESEHETDEEVKVKPASKRHASKSGGEKTTPRPNKRVAASKRVDNREKDSESEESQQETEEEVKVKPTKRHHKKKGDRGITKVKDKHRSGVGESDVERKRSGREKTTPRSSKRVTKRKRVDYNVDYNESDGESEGSSEEPSQPLHAEGKKKRDSHSKQKAVKQVKDKQKVRSSRKEAAKGRDSESEHETDEEVRVKPPSKRHASKSGGEKTTPRPNKRVAASKRVDNREEDSESEESQQETEEEVKVKPTKRHHKKKGDKGITKVKEKHRSGVGESDVERKRSGREKTTPRSSKRVTVSDCVNYDESGSENGDSQHEKEERVKVKSRSKRCHENVSKESDNEDLKTRPAVKRRKRDIEIEESLPLSKERQSAKNNIRSAKDKHTEGRSQSETEEVKVGPQPKRRKEAREDEGEGQLTDCTPRTVSHAKVQKALKTIHSKLWAHRTSWPFEYPVDAMQVPDYYEVISKPMDLTTILSKLDGYTAEKFVEDVRQMIFNSFDYNTKDSKTAKLTVEFEVYFEKLLTKYLPYIKYTSQKTLFGF